MRVAIVSALLVAGCGVFGWGFSQMSPEPTQPRAWEAREDYDRRYRQWEADLASHRDDVNRPGRVPSLALLFVGTGLMVAAAIVGAEKWE